MTTDAFTTAAAAEARRESPLYDNEVLSYGVRMAEWARDHLARQEPTDAEVEAAALTLCEMEGDDPDDMALYRDQARAALTAAKEARA